ncbi:hypothetical protein ACFQE1_20980, partial [Halobium palmae]
MESESVAVGGPVRPSTKDRFGRGREAGVGDERPASATKGRFGRRREVVAGYRSTTNSVSRPTRSRRTGIDGQSWPSVV